MYAVIAKNEAGKFEVEKDEIMDYTEAKKFSVTLPGSRIVPAGRLNEALELANS